MLICNTNMMRFLSLLLLCLSSCGRLWSVCEVVVVPYDDAVTVMRVLLFVLHMCMLRGGWKRCGYAVCKACGWYTWFRYCLAQLTC